MSNLMSTKLDSSNYMIWKLQITVVLDAYSMLEHLDGSIPKPNQFLTIETGIQAVNPDFLVWNKKDKALLTLLYSTCSSSVLAMVIEKSSSQEVWNTLEERFTSTARSNVLNLKLELQSIKKTGNEIVSTYLQRIKTMRDKFSAVGVHSDHEELIHTEEQSMSEATESLSNSALAMFVSHNKPSFNGNHGFNRGRGRNSYSRGRNGGGRNYNQGFSSLNTSTPHYQQQQYQQQQISPPAQQASHTTFQSKNERPTCQICWKMGHYAIDCYHRMNFAYQGKNPTTKLAAMASASNLQYTQNAEAWLTDTGATDHITANASNLSHQSPYQGQEQVSVGNGQGLPIQNIGRLLYKGLSNNGVYPIQSSLFIPNANKTACAAHFISSDKWHLWHSRLGHPSAKVLANVFPCFNTSSTSKIVQEHCHHCLAGKMHQLPFPTSNKTVNSPFELIHADLWGPAPVVASNSFRFYLVLVDEFTKFTWVYLLKHKSETFQVFTQFKAMIDTQFSLPIKILRIDCGERKHRHLVQCALALLSQSKLPMSYWSYAVSTAAHLINKLPTPNLVTNRIYTSRHVLFNEKVFPGLKHPTVSSSQFPASPSVDSWLNLLLLQHTCSHNSLVISPTSHESSPIPPGQCPLHTASVPVPITDPTATYSSPLSTAPIPDHTAPYSNPLPTASIPDHTAPYSSPLPTASIPDHTAEFNVPLLSHIPLPTGFTNNPTPIPTSLPTNPIPNLHSDTVPLSDNTHSTDMPLPHTHLPLTVPHPMQTRSKSGIVKPKLTYAALIDYALTEPTSYTVASKHSSWCTAMDEEFQALQKQGTWSLVPLPPSKNVVGCKWVYKLKTHSDGSIARYKARLVAKGFHQQHGIDFTETFSPVIKPPTVRLILSLAVSLNWPLRQLDVKNAFLHGTLKEEVYMTQPQGYIDPIHPQYVCKLQKSIYGLKQAPRAWFESFTTQLLHLGFIASTADSSLFIYKEHKVIAYLLLYVDDIVLTSNTPAFLDTLIHKLSSVFDLKDLGSLHYFLGLQVTRTPSRLYINQAKYAQDLLKKHNMLDCKPASSPSCPNTRLSLHDGDPLPDPHAYRSMVGALHYLTFTRPDISFAVHQVCQYMSTPTTTHLAAAKRVLRYIRGTFNHGIEFTPGPLSLSAYTDADWAGDPDDRRSTYGFLVYLGHNAITWSAKKQATVSRSSTESEYRALAIASAELCWVRSLLKDLGIYLPDPPTLWCDNISALAIASNPVFHARTKHIEVDFHFVRERVLRKDLLVKFVSTVDQLADIFTKSLSTHRFLELRRNLTVPVPKIEGG
uniref:Integrase catalytic domain-containing protein n=1 Tax=Fagus sylvatica TaxID=28930 RepID=A0A2N9HE74_FAGSY